jgi:hypothetical protein
MGGFMRASAVTVLFVVLLARFVSAQDYKALERQVEAATHFSGFALEAFAGRRITPFVRVKAGLTYDFNFETGNLQPVVLASLGF